MDATQDVAHPSQCPESAYDKDLTFRERIQALMGLEGRDAVRSINEEFWAAVHPQLNSRGYMLRPRYRSGWKPSWKSILETIEYDIEDAIPAPNHAFIDAERINDHTTVGLKRTIPSHAEKDIASYFSTQPLRSDLRNHCVPILDVFTVSHLSTIYHETFHWTILVMPLLRKFDDPPFETVGDCISFVHQMLEGLSFIHDHKVAHRDCTGANIMMDATPIFPDGWHPQAPWRSRNAKYPAKPISRRSVAVPIRYYYADWGLSSYHPDDPEPRVVGEKGKDKRPPELSDQTPYDPYKLDVHIVGGLILDSILLKTASLDFLIPLVRDMTRVVPAERPSASTALQVFETGRSHLTPRNLRATLRPRSQASIFTRTLLDCIDMAREGYFAGEQLFTAAWKLAFGWHRNS